MRRFIVAACLMLILIGICCASLWNTRHSSQILSEKVVHIAYRMPRDYEWILAELYLLEEQWRELKGLLTHHVRHDSMGDIASAFARAKVYAEAEEELHLQAELVELYRLFADIGIKEALTLDNIL